MALTKNEASYVIGFLNELDNQFSNDGCNDMYLKDTPENRKMFLEAEKLWCQDNCDEEDELEEVTVEEALQTPLGRGKKEKKIGTNNQAIIAYLRKRLMDEYGLVDKDIPDTANW